MQLAVAEGRRERKKRELRERIYEAARQLFQESGFEATTVEQIAVASGVAQATLFNHFQSKRALLREMTGEVFTRIEAILHAQLSQPGTVQQRLAGFADQCARELGRWRGLAHNVVLELAQSSTRPGEAIPHIWRIYEPFAAMFEDGQRAGEVSREVDPAFAAELFVGAFTVFVSRWINDPDYPIEQRMRQTAAFFGQAIGSGAAGVASAVRQRPKRGEERLVQAATAKESPR